MRLIVLLLAVILGFYLVMTQMEENTPIVTDPESGQPVMYGEQLDKARNIENFMLDQVDKSQQQADQRLEQADKPAK